MSSFTLNFATEKDLYKWDALVSQSYNGTLFHKRKFLSYHGDKFKGQDRFLIFRKGEIIKGLIAIAIDDLQKDVARSTYGASYGGVVLMEKPTYSSSLSIINTLMHWIQDQGINDFSMTAPIGVCSTYGVDVFSFTLLEQGFKSISRDISSVVRLNNPNKSVIDAMTGNARNMSRKALKNGLIINHDVCVDVFYPILQNTYAKHGTCPTHTIDELKLLNNMFESEVRCHVAMLGSLPVAGICEFIMNNRVNSSFYFCQLQAYKKLQGLSLLVYDALDRAEKSGFSYYDFGTSTTAMSANAAVFKFKESYGAFGVFRETFNWSNRVDQ